MPPRYSSGVKMVASIHGSWMSRIAHHVRHVGRVVQVDRRAVAHVQLVDHRRRRRDEVEVELAAQALLDDFEVEQAEEATAEAEAERGGGFHLVGEAGVVEAQAAHGGAQVFELRGVDREEAAEHDRLDFAEAGQRFFGRLAFVGDGVADRAVGHGLDRGGEEADFARSEFVGVDQLAGQEHADAVERVVRAGLHHLDLSGASSACHRRSAR